MFAEISRLPRIREAADLVYRAMPPTPQYAWPLLCEALGTQVWVKHENHTPTGAFKVRGGLVYFEGLRRREPDCRGVISATRGNHGQSIGFAARRHGLAATIVVPRGNSREKNAAMRALGVELLEHGEDFQAAREQAQRVGADRGLHAIPSFHPDLVLGVASAWVEFLESVPDLDLLFVPIGLGSGICAAATARAALGAGPRIIGVVSTQAEAYALSFEQHRPVQAPALTEVADGMACRVPDAQALDIIWSQVDDMVRVDDQQVLRAMRLYYTATHNLAEGAGAAALAAALSQGERLRGRRVGLWLSGGNVDLELFRRAMDLPPEDTAPRRPAQ
jgi:threonine dehydratase